MCHYYHRHHDRHSDVHICEIPSLPLVSLILVSQSLPASASPRSRRLRFPLIPGETIVNKDKSLLVCRQQQWLLQSSPRFLSCPDLLLSSPAFLPVCTVFWCAVLHSSCFSGGSRAQHGTPGIAVHGKVVVVEERETIGRSSKKEEKILPGVSPDDPSRTLVLLPLLSPHRFLPVIHITGRHTGE